MDSKNTRIRLVESWRSVRGLVRSGPIIRGSGATIRTSALAALLCSTYPSLAQDQLWIQQFGTSLFNSAAALVSDGAEGVFVAGSSNGPLAGDADAYLARYDEAGTRLWFRQFGESNSDFASALADDGAGGVMIAGSTWGNLGGPNAGSVDAFLARYDGAGNQLWLVQFGTTELDYAVAAVPDAAGGVIVAGYTRGSLGGPRVGRHDAFLARYNGNGNQVWIRLFGTVNDDKAFALAPDGGGGVFVAGETKGGLNGPNAGSEDAFLARFDSAGNQIWIRQFGTARREMAHALSPDGAGGVFVAGETQGNLGGPNAGHWDAFLAHYDGTGNQLWIRQFGTPDADSGRALATAGAGGVFVAGQTHGSMGGPNVGSADIFLARYDSMGTRFWIRQFGSSSGEQTRALASDGIGGVFVGGETWGSMATPMFGQKDAFVTRFSDGSCYPDCDHSTGSGVLDIFDFLCWQNDFVAGNSYACDCDTTTGPLVCDIFDFLCFQDAFVGGCP